MTPMMDAVAPAVATPIKCAPTAFAPMLAAIPVPVRGNSVARCVVSLVATAHRVTPANRGIAFPTMGVRLLVTTTFVMSVTVVAPLALAVIIKAVVGLACAPITALVPTLVHPPQPLAAKFVVKFAGPVPKALFANRAPVLPIRLARVLALLANATSPMAAATRVFVNLVRPVTIKTPASKRALVPTLARAQGAFAARCVVKIVVRAKAMKCVL